MGQELKTIEDLIEQLELPQRPLQTPNMIVLWTIPVLLMGVICFVTFLVGSWGWFALSLLAIGLACSQLFFQEQIQLTEQSFTSWSLWKGGRYEVQWAEIEEISFRLADETMSIHTQSQVWETAHPNNWPGEDQPYMMVLLFKKTKEHNIRLREDGLVY